MRIQQVQNEVENRPIKLDFLGNMRQKFEMAVNFEEMKEKRFTIDHLKITCIYNRLYVYRI